MAIHINHGKLKLHGGHLYAKDKTGKSKKVEGDGMFADGGGLYAQNKLGGESWVFRFFSPTHKRERYMGLGPRDTIDLDEAREMARQCRRQLLLDKIDPIDARKTKQQNDELAKFRDKTYRQAGDEWYAENLKTWKRHRQEIVKSRLTRYVYPIIGDLPVQRLCTEAHDDAANIIHTVLTQDVDGVPFWEKYPPQAKETHHDMHRIMERAWAQGYLRKGDYLATDMEGKLGKLLTAQDKFYRSTPHAALKWKVAGQFMADIRARRDQTGSPGIEPERRAISGLATEFLMLTGARKTMVATARWDDIDLDAAYWLCPEHKTDKGGKGYEVFLSPQAMAVLDKMKAIRVNEYVFPGGRNGRRGHLRPGSLDAFMKKQMKRPDITRHGFRTSIQSYGRSHGFKDVVLEKVLNHVGPGLMSIYARDTDVEPDIRRLMEAWGQHCDRPQPLPGKLTAADELEARRAAKRIATK